MITWRDEGERSMAYIGEARCGSVGKRRWQSIPAISDADFPFDWQALDPGPTAAGNEDAAKAALEAAVEDWVKRAGLVSAELSPAGVIAALKAFYHVEDLRDIGNIKAAKRDISAAILAALKENGT